MAERVVSIKLLANATGLLQGFNRAKDAASELKSKVTESARSQREDWATVGTGLTAVGVAVTGLGVAALRTGVQYNTLQQTTRAALTTLLGSAQAANAQMDKLDEFAKNSPFAKGTFITAQQQMLAFGIETQKVIPYLDAVQDAVAAAGGSNQQIEEIAFIMAQISSAGKITGQDLLQFGQRGVNAAELIGSQMGKTAAQIREDITAGALDADQALDALAKGMAEKYDGAAENVKNTFEGAMDRVKAAWRDFASELAKPLVDPNGGGALIDLLNWTADAMRNFEKLPEPVKATVSALTGLAGTGALVTGAAILAVPKWVEFTSSLADLGVTALTAKDKLAGIMRFLLGPWGIAMGLAVASVAAFNNAMESSKVSAAQLETSIKQGASALEVMGREAAKNEQGLTRVFVDVGSQVENLGPLLDKAANSGRGFFSSLSFNEQGMLSNLSEFGVALQNLAADDLPRAQQEFASFAEEAGLTRAQLKTALGEMPGFKEALLDYAESAGYATDDTTLLRIAMNEIKPAATASAQGLEEIQGAAVDTSAAVSDLAKAISEFGDAQISSEEAAIKFEEQLALVIEQVNSGSVGMDKATEAGRANTQSLLDLANATAESAAKTLEATGSQEAANAVLQRGRDALIDAATAYFGSRDAAVAYVDQLLATPETIATQVQLDKEAAEASLSEFQRKLDLIPDVVPVNVQVMESLIYSDAGLKSKYGRAYGGTVGFAQGGTVGGLGGYVSGGTVYGRGGTKSDSITVNLSRGEEVIQEPFASMYRAELKQMNRGDFAPSQPIVLAQPQSGSSAPVSVTQNVYPRPGMSEMEVGRIAASRIGDEVGRLL